MRVLQLVSDWKWTGPAEPMLTGLQALRARGHEVDLACPEAPDSGERGLAARARGLGVAPVFALDRGRGIHPGRDRDDARRVREWIATRAPDVVHAWHSRCHALALRAAGLSPRRRRVAVVRSVPGAAPIPPWPWNLWLYGPGCDGLHCPSPGSAVANARLRGGRPILGCFGTASPRALRGGDRARGRRALGLDGGEPVVGIAARVQRHRRFDLLLRALDLARREAPGIRLVVLGRGTHLDAVARRPAERLGLGDRVVLAGHRTDDYVDALAAFDVFTYVVPGSDGSCRALLEAQALGLPAVVSRRGALPEIVVDGRTGRVVDETPEAFARAWLELLGDAGRRAGQGAAARERALAAFTPERWAEQVEGLYGSARSSLGVGAASRSPDSSAISR